MIKKDKIHRDHVIEALDAYLKSMKLITPGYTVVDFSGAGTHFTIITENEKNA